MARRRYYQETVNKKAGLMYTFLQPIHGISCGYIWEQFGSRLEVIWEPFGNHLAWNGMGWHGMAWDDAGMMVMMMMMVMTG